MKKRRQDVTEYTGVLLARGSAHSGVREWTIATIATGMEVHACRHAHMEHMATWGDRSIADRSTGGDKRVTSPPM